MGSVSRWATSVLCIIFLFAGRSDAANCDTVNNKCDLKLTAFTLTPQAPVKPGVAIKTDFSVTLTNEDANNDIAPAGAGKRNVDCIMRFASSDISGGAPAGTDPFATAPIATFSAADCTLDAGTAILTFGIFSTKSRVLTGSCSLTISNAACPNAKFMCLDCAVPTGAAEYSDKKTNNNIGCQRVDSDLTCDIDISLQAMDGLCSQNPLVAGGDVTVTLTKVTVKNENPKLPGRFLNDIKSHTGNFAFEYVFSTSDVPINAVGGAVSFIAEWNDAIKAEGEIEKTTVSATYKLEDADCPTADFICGRVKKGSTKTYTEITTPAAKANKNYKCCRIDTIKKCRPDPEAISVTNNPVVTFIEGKATATTLDVGVAIKTGTGNIAAAGTGENFKFKQFFAVGDYCADNTKATFPAAPTRCTPGSTVSGTSPTAANAALNDGDPTATFKISCSMTLPTADCLKMTHLCVEFAPGTGATYVDRDTNNNCKCTTAAIQRQCKPNVEAVSLSENGGPVTLANYGTQPALGLDLVIKNIEPAASSIPAAGGTPNFEVNCFISDGGGVTQINGLKKITPLNNEGVKLDGGPSPPATSVTLTGSVTFTLLSQANCPEMKQVCCEVKAPGTPPNYVETKTTDNKKCSTAIRYNCKPYFTGPITTAAGLAINLEENTPPGTRIFQLSTVTVNPTDNPGVKRTLTYVKTTGDGRFAVDTATGDVTVTSAFNFEAPAGGPFPIEFTVEDQAGATTKSTGKLVVTITDVNEKPTITGTAKPNPETGIDVGSVKGTKGPGAHEIGVPELYIGPIYEFTFTDVDAAHTPANANWPALVLTAPVGATSPFTFTKNGANKGILSIKKGVLDFESANKVYKVKVKACDIGGVPPPPPPPPTPPPPAVLCSDDIEVTVNVLNNDEPPKWDASTIKVVKIKEDVTAANTDVITVTAIDVDTTELKFDMQCNPVTNIFDFTPKIKKGKKLTIKHKADPKFDFETRNTYTCNIFVMDGVNPAVMGQVTINIEDVPEDPKMNLPLSKTITIPELHCYGCHLFDFKCTDEDAGQKTTKSFSVYDTPFDRQAKSKFQMDSQGRILLNFENNIVHSKLDKYLTKFSCCDTAGTPRCVSQDITLVVERSNQAPTLSPNTTGITITEKQLPGAANKIDVGLVAKFNDPDGDGRTPSCSIVNSRYSSYFKVTGNQLHLEKPLNYDTHTPPHHFYISISCSDQQGQARTDAPDVPALSAEMLVEVNVQGIDDHAPVFKQTSYTATLFEDAFSSQSVVTVSATDADLGVHGQMIYQLDPNDPQAVLANQLFSVMQLDNEHAEIRCRSGLDAEKYSVVVFEVNAVSPGPPKKLSGTTTVTIHVRNVNDLRPQWVTPDYINLEISTTAPVDTLMTTVKCTDADILYNDVNYDQISVTYGGIDFFKTNVYTGEVRSNSTPYEEDMRYFVRVVCKDTDPKEDFSGIAVVRIDTYVNWKHVTNWTMCNTMAHYTAAEQSKFLASVATLCPPCIPKIHNITEKDGKAVFQLYFIKDNTTYAKNAREYDKKFIEVTTILERYYDEVKKAPKQSVLDNPVFGGCLVNITRFAYPPKTNWFLDTIIGNMVLGLLMSLGFMLLMTAVICTVRKAAPGKMKMPVTPKPKPKRPITPRNPTPRRPSPPPSPDIDYDERTPTPDVPQRMKFGKFI